jgi:hypothetical protein
MRALVVRQPWANLIADGLKAIEIRLWTTTYRGPLVICAGARPLLDLAKLIEVAVEPLGCVLCVVDLRDVRPLRRRDFYSACAAPGPVDGLFAWVLRAPNRLKPMPVKGQLGIFPIPASLVVPA